jgi:hypothetical protein
MGYHFLVYHGTRKFLAEKILLWYITLRVWGYVCLMQNPYGRTPLPNYILK